MKSLTPLPPCHIRAYRPGEAPSLLELFRDTVRRINCRDYSSTQIAAWASDAIDSQMWEAQFSSRFTCVAEKGGVIVGFADLESTGHLDRFYVHADHQGEGIGKQLLHEIERESRRTGVLRVFTEASVTARPFFEGQGFGVLARQEVICREVSFVNFRMEKLLPPVLVN